MSSTNAKFSPLFSRKAAGGVYTVAGIDDAPGDVWFVDSNATNTSDASGYGMTPDSPFATLAYAFSSDAVSSGDVVYVMPGHAETLDAAGDITMDIAGVSVVGLGKGTSRPTFTFATLTTATWLITAANVSVKNVLITVTGTIDVANAITVTGTDSLLEDVEFRDSAATSQFADFLILGATSTRARVVRPVVRSHASGDAAQSGILISSAVDGIEIVDPQIDGLFATGCFASSAAATNTTIQGGFLRQRHATQDAAINLNASNTGFIDGVRIRTATNDQAGFDGAIVAASAQWYDVLVSNANGTVGITPNVPATSVEVAPNLVYYVDSTASGAADAATNGTSKSLPFATVAYAFSSNRVTSGDVVYVMPGHAETVNAAGDITMDIAGVKVVGLGRGTARPTFTFATDTAATWLITAANISVENVLVTTTGTIDVVSGITVTGADCHLVDVEVRDNAADSQFVDPLIISTGAARAKLIRPVVRSHASGDAAQSGILISAAVDGVEIDDANIDGLHATGCIESTAAATNTIIRRPILRQRHATQDAAINLNASNTGFVDSARIRVATNDQAGLDGAIVAASAQWYDVLVTTASGTVGVTATPNVPVTPSVEEAPNLVYYVDSNATGASDAATHGTTKALPFATLAYAFSSNRVTSGDTVYVMPGHAESITAAGGITMDIAGVKVVGLGRGSSRPTFTWGTDTAATWLITAANVSVDNVLCTTTGTIDVVAGIVVTGADARLTNIEARDSAADSQFVDFLGLSTGAARGLVEGFRFVGHASGDANASACQVTAAVDGVRVEDFWAIGLFAAAGLETTAANTNMLVKDVYVEQQHATTDAGITLNAGTTGLLIDCVVKSATNDANGFNNALVGAGAAWFNPLVCNLAGERGGAPLTASAAA
jgi:hypothetical protein